MSSEIVKASPTEMVKMAIESGADLSKLEKLLELQERWEAGEAKKQFALAFARVQSDIVTVIKTKDNAQTKSRYATLENIIENAKPVYTEQGFSVIFYEADAKTEGCMRICADILHTAGHKETYHYDVPLDGIGFKGNPNMTKIHAKASSTSYGRRYLMCMIWNIPTGDDNDAQGVGVELIDEEQVSQLTKLITETDINLDKFLKYLGVEKLEELSKSKYVQAVSTIETKRKKAGK